MRIRTIKPEFWRHEVMAQLAPEAQLMALALLNMADDEGYFEANPRIVRGEVMPFRDDLATVSRDLRELSRVGWIEVRNTSGHGHVGLIVNWAKHQRVDHPKASKLSVYFDASDSREAFAPSSREPRDASREEVEQGTGNREVEQGTFPATVAPAPSKPAKAVKATDPRHHPLKLALLEAFLTQRGTAYPFGARDAAEVAKLLAHGIEPERVVEAWRRALAHQSYPSVSTLAELNTHMARFVGTGPPTLASTRAPAPVADWSTVTPGEVSL